MHLFVTGGSGITGPAVVTELVSAGHRVTGLARSDASAARLEGLGAAVRRGDLADLDALRAGAAASDGVIHMAFSSDFGDPEGLVRLDTEAVTAMGEALRGTDKPLVMTSGTFAMVAGRVSVEPDPPDQASAAHFRIPGEQACLSFADQGVRASVVRLSPTVHGPGDYGFIAMLVAAARKAGVAPYIGDGANRWPAVHRNDAAMLFRLAAEKAPAGSCLHGVDESGITQRTIAETVGRKLGLPTASLTQEEMAPLFAVPFIAGVFAIDAPASSALTRSLLGWTPTHPTLLEDLEAGDYFDEAAPTWPHA
jgi:nucleoside-diphosphate-sugar epimerase